MTHTTTPSLLATRDTLAKALTEHEPTYSDEMNAAPTGCECGEWSSGDGDGWPDSWSEHVADALAGVVRDPATLADDEALVERIGKDPEERVVVRYLLRSLAAALTEDPS